MMHTHCVNLISCGIDVLWRKIIVLGIVFVAF